MVRKWQIINNFKFKISNLKLENVVSELLKSRGIKTKKEIEVFLHPPNPYTLNPHDVGISKTSLAKAIVRIRKAIKDKEPIVVYADYDADGITAGAIVWETLHKLGANAMPYIPHRVEEGYGLSIKGLDTVKKLFDPTLIITVDHGITGKEKIEYAKKLGMEVIVTDHHVKPKALPKCNIVHTTKLSGAGIAWYLTKEILQRLNPASLQGLTLTHLSSELLALTAIGTIADMVPLVGPNRAIVKYGLEAINKTKRVGLEALIADASLIKGNIGTYEISHILAPRLNAMGRIEHALDALRLLCTRQKEKAIALAQKLGLINRQRQQLTEETVLHARELFEGRTLSRQGPTFLKQKLVFISHESFNQGVIGLVAGKLVEEYYRPAVVVSKGEVYSKASARSINGFDIIEAIRSCSDILVDVGGHPMAAGFTLETKHLKTLQRRLEELAEKELDEEKLTRKLRIDAEIPLGMASAELWKRLQDFQPFGFGNPEPIFVSRGVRVVEAHLVGVAGKHLKLVLQPTTYNLQPTTYQAIAFNQGELYGKLCSGQLIDIAYSIDMDTWNGNQRLQLKIKDIRIAP